MFGIVLKEYFTIMHIVGSIGSNTFDFRLVCLAHCVLNICLAERRYRLLCYRENQTLISYFSYNRYFILSRNDDLTV